MVALVITGGSKLVTVVSNYPGLDAGDPVLPFLSTKHLLIASLGIEVALLYLLLFAVESGVWLPSLTWISSVFVTYQVGTVVWGNPSAPCPCLGRVPEWLEMSTSISNAAMRYLAVVLFVGSAALLFLRADVHRCGRHT